MYFKLIILSVMCFLFLHALPLSVGQRMLLSGLWRVSSIAGNRFTGVEQKWDVALSFLISAAWWNTCAPDCETGEVSHCHAGSASTSGMHLAQLMNCSHFKETHLLVLYFSDASLQMWKAGLCLDFCSRVSSLLLCWGRVKIFSSFFSSPHQDSQPSSQPK